MAVRSERFCDWFHRYRWIVFAGWLVHATILHLVYLGFPSWDALAYRVPPIVELIQHGELGAERYDVWSMHGFLPFAELAHLPFLYVFGLTGLLIGYPLVVFPLCVIAVYKLGRQLTGTVHGGNFAALAYAAIPMVNQQPFTGYIDFIVSAVIAYLVYAVLRLRASPRPLRSAPRVAIATLLFTMTRATGVYIGVVLLGLIGLALFVERGGRLGVRLVHRRALVAVIAGYLAGSVPILVIQIYKYLHHGSPLYPYQFNVLGLKIGGGMSTRDLFSYGGLTSETWGNFLHSTYRGWIWPVWRDGLSFFDSRNFGGGFVLVAALAALPAFVRSATRFEKWLVIACVLVSLLARDFWLPRYAYTIVVAITVVLGRALPALASAGRWGRAVFWLLTGALFLHLLRPELDMPLSQTRRGMGPRLNVAGSGRFLGGTEAMQPYPDVHAQLAIVDRSMYGFVLPLYGRWLTNEVVATVHITDLGDTCEGLRPIAEAHPGVIFVDDYDATSECERQCVLHGSRGECLGYRYSYVAGKPVGVPRTGVGATGAGRAWLTSGWSFPEDWGVWSTGTDSVLTIPIPTLSDDMTLELRWVAAEAGMTAQVDTGGGARQVAFPAAQALQRDSFPIQARSSPVVVRIHVDRAVAAPDGRMLGIGLHTVRVRVRLPR
jgi:hypothetical protein